MCTNFIMKEKTCNGQLILHTNWMPYTSVPVAKYHSIYYAQPSFGRNATAEFIVWIKFSLWGICPSVQQC